ncbi:MAG TPA: TldD/PmbA family protein [Acidimicrobiales bacterium]|nr:TldD/PmbA family protein [Acidimicrobiales bacterium]
MRDDLVDLAARVARQARPGEEVEAYVAWSRETSVEAYSGEVESLSSADAEGVGVRVVSGSRQGYAYAGSLDPAVIAQVLEDARDNATFTTPDEFVGLPEPDGVVAADIDPWSDEMASVATADKVAVALELERVVRASDPRIRQVEAASYGDVTSVVAVASSKGVNAFQRRTGAYLSVYALAGEGDDTQTGGGYSVGRSLSDLDVEKAAADAVERATRLLGAKKPRSVRLPVVFDKRVTTTLLGIVASTFSGEAVLKGRSLFADRLGDNVAASSVTLVDDPTLAEAFGASRYDGEGLASRRNVLIRSGVADHFLYDSYSGRRAGAAPTGSAVRAGFKSGPGVGHRAVYLVPGDKDAEQIMREVGNGLLVQSVIGVHSGVNPVSGDFSVGVEGLMIRDGELAEPVREATIASTLQRMLLDVSHVGNDMEWLPGSAAGVTLAVDGISLSGS